MTKDEDLMGQLKGMLQNMPKIPFMHVICHPSDKEQMEAVCRPANEMIKMFGIPMTCPSEEACHIIGLEPKKAWSVTNKDTAKAVCAVIDKVEKDLDSPGMTLDTDPKMVRDAIRMLINVQQ